MTGDGLQTRLFCYVDDLIDGLVCLMGSSDDVTGPLNLRNPAECTMLELAQSVIDLTGSRSEIRFYPLPTDDPRRRQPDITKAKTILNWTPKTPLREGLEKTVMYFEELLSLNRRRT